MSINPARLMTNYREWLATELWARDRWSLAAGRMAADLAWERACSVEILYPSSLQLELEQR